MADVITNPSLNDGSIVSYYEFVETSGTRFDSHGSNNLSVTNAPTQTSGIVNSAIVFDDTNSQWCNILDASQSGLDFAGNFSFQMWLYYTEAISGAQVYLTKGGTNSGFRSYRFFYNTVVSAFRFQVSADGSTWQTCDYSITPSLDTWYHVVGTYNTSGDMNIYVDTAVTNASVTGGALNNSSLGFTLGTSYTLDESTVSGTYANCYMAELFLASKEWDTDDISDLYNSGAGIPYDEGTGGFVLPPYVALNRL